VTNKRGHRKRKIISNSFEGEEEEESESTKKLFIA
jgi:hypothetical protein